MPSGETNKLQIVCKWTRRQRLVRQSRGLLCVLEFVVGLLAADEIPRQSMLVDVGVVDCMTQ